MKRSEAVSRIASVIQHIELQKDENGRIIEPSAKYVASLVMELYDQLSESFNLRNQPYWTSEDNN